jgi:predicted transport protein
MPLTPPEPLWTCPKCRRTFARAQQRHICSSGTRAQVLKHRREEVVELFETLEQQVKSFGPVEFVARERYIILRSKHIFSDVIMLADALKVIVHLPRMARHPLFRKIVADRRWVSHTAKVRNSRELEQIQPFLRAAWEYAQTY